MLRTARILWLEETCYHSNSSDRSCEKLSNNNNNLMVSWYQEWIDKMKIKEPLILFFYLGCQLVFFFNNFI